MIQLQETELLSAVEMQEMIDEMLDNEPDGRKKLVHREWAEKVNKLILSYNERFGRTYTLRK